MSILALRFNHLIVFETNRTVSRNHSTFETNVVAAPTFAAAHAFLLASPLSHFFTRVCSWYVGDDEKEEETACFEPSTLGAMGGRIIPLDHDAPRDN